MIVVKVEIWPFGDEKKAHEIGRLLIHNRGDHPDRPRRGNYGVRLLRRGSKTAIRRTAEVLNHARLSNDVWKLIRKALESLDV